MNTHPNWTSLRNATHKPAILWWAKRDTRWDVYPGREPVELIAFNSEGFWLPLPDGRWFRSPISYVLVGEACTPALFGEWQAHRVTEHCVTHHFLRLRSKP